MFALLLSALALAAAPPPVPTEEGPFQLDMVTADMLRTQCEGGDLVACHRLGRRYEQGMGGVKVSPVDAATWYRKGCDAGVMMDCGLGANAMVHANDATAHTLAKKGCDAKDTVACYVLGHTQLVGIGTKAEPAAGLARIVAACDAGLSVACAELGQVYAGAVPGVTPDHAKARPLLETACTEKDYAACGWLASMLLMGQGGPADPPRGVSTLETACNGGFAISCESLASVYIQGIGVPADPKRAVPWLVKACDGRQGASCAQLATMTLQGQGGLLVNRAKAITHLKQACTYGHQPACDEADSACRSGATDACR